MNAVASARLWAGATATAVSASVLIVSGVASADPLSAGCTQPESAGPVTCVYTSGVNELLLPEGVTSITVTAIGGRGGNVQNNSTAHGGQGAEVTGTLAVPSGTRTLYAVVGGNGEDRTAGIDRTGGAGGANGGGNGGTPGDRYFIPFPGAGGGGASDIRTTPGDLASRFVAAAGGGGSSRNRPGGDAGGPGQSGNGGSGNGGTAAQAGTDTAGGTAGGAYTGGDHPGDNRWNGADGVLGAGGAGAPVFDKTNRDTGGGGGGGGLYGGGGGHLEGSGAGGSSLAPAGTTVSLTDAAPSVTITYQPPTVPPQPPTCTGSVCLSDGLFGSS